MNEADKVILVTGATGQQGGATARQLVARGWKVRALVRTPSSAAARELARLGIDLVPGDMGDRASLEQACEGVYGVFSVQPSALSVGGAQDFDEVRLGKNMADAAKGAGVRHFVYASVGAADRQSGVSFFETKWRIEEHVRSLALPATILRPVQFMDTLLTPLFGLPDALALVTASDVVWQLIAVNDIGAFAARAFEDPDEYRGKAIEIAGDALTGAQIATLIGRALGRSLPCVEVPDAILRQQSDFLRLRELLTDGGGWNGDIPALRRLHPGLMDLETWLGGEGKKKIDAIRNAP